MKVGLLIAAYNRPEYLRQCLESVAAADLSQVSTILIVDDASTDPETRRLIDDFDLPGVELIKAFSKENRSIKGSLLFGFDVLYSSCDVFINLDSDAIVKRDAFNRLIEAHKIHPLHIITGFNCLTKNKDGSERHVVIERGEGFNIKKSVGGINMIFEGTTYLQIIKPALIKSLKENLNWDHQACLISYNGYGRGIICLEPSCVQHIGINSAMGHSAGGEPPDVASDFLTEDNYQKLPDFLKKLKLPNVTLVGADCVSSERLLRAAEICKNHIQFGDVKMFSSLPSVYDSFNSLVKIDPISTKEEYSWFVMKELAKHVTTSHMLVIQYDGYVLNHAAWKDEWLEWDYIGAPWNWYTTNKVGNGGFSLRSKKLMDAVANDNKIFPVSDGLNTHKEEDHCICRIYRKHLEDNYGIKFAPVEVARQFSIEGWRSENKTWTNEFGFHGHGLTNIKP